MNRNLIKQIPVIAIALALVGAVVMAPASTAATTTHRYITVSADGTVKVTPDAVRLNGTVSVVAGTSKDALAQASSSAAVVRTALIANGIAIKDISTQTLTVYPEYNYTAEKGSALVGYRGSQSFTAIIHNATNAGAVVDAVVAAGGDNLQVNGVTPFILDSTKATASARSVAVKSAKAKAISYASLLGVKLGVVNYLIENSSPSTYPPMMGVARDAAGATQIDLGQQDVTVSITIEWALR